MASRLGSFGAILAPQVKALSVHHAEISPQREVQGRFTAVENPAPYQGLAEAWFGFRYHAQKIVMNAS
ncbi:hypothetical protein N7523_005274 [Penicillium sp. IBT 18751x]|nr:hypothetical protein N7523_005274 [Penicillium sp. IBT 18751x]